MAANQPPWPREWLMTDERMGEGLWEALQALPEGGGVVFRHYSTPPQDRVRLAGRVAELCRAGGLKLDVARDAKLARNLGAQLAHNPVGDRAGLPFSRSAHSLGEARAACASGASLIFLSSIFPTQSHPGAVPFPRDEARAIVAECPVPVIALGGMNRARFDEVKNVGFYGWAGIDAWLPAAPPRE